MYIPSSFEVTDKEELYEFMEDHSFAVLFSQIHDVPTATHLPLLLDRKKGCLYGHMAKANPQWEDIQNEVLVVFNGPHTYISPSWYETNQAVPTWNYTAVHVTGKFSIIAKQHDLLHILEQTTHVYESSMLKPWEMSNLDSKLLNHLTDAIVGFKIEISKIEGVRKLSQNHSKERRQRVIHKLEGNSDDDAKRIAELMKREMQNEYEE
jgi:transcriptional regulator